MVLNYLYHLCLQVIMVFPMYILIQQNGQLDFFYISTHCIVLGVLEMFDENIHKHMFVWNIEYVV